MSNNNNINSKETLLFVFSGTGNSLYVAQKVQSHLTHSRIISLSKALSEQKLEWSAPQIGFIFPVYFRDIPHVVEKFLKNISIKDNPYLFAIATNGGEGGHPFKLMNKILHKQEKKLNAGFLLAMPQNSIVGVDKLHKHEEIIQILDSSEMVISDIIECILQNQENQKDFVKPTLSNRMMAWGGKFSMFRVLNDRKFRVDEEKCIGCGICQRVCPMENIELIDKKPKWNHNCECCTACIHWCPRQAVVNVGTEGKPRYHHPEISVKQISSY
ncbi:hypothetical protein NEF87_000801 [Candidatus Lokiarchaeum ossiferum]|uniref:4Fe-4S ferredoxin-type domain-containing protein n=1 Tax=Candidatus Lokiarchaeum ossiferum TaxID=2951803 RepID=A0ABY6HLX4_9ARCH|nr:hypothetical protein NEF87_000801 [Candidatus Lokiarchaeum sp. B-35]